MAYIKFNKEEAERFKKIPKVTMETFLEMGFLKFNEDGSAEVDDGCLKAVEQMVAEGERDIHTESTLPDKIKDALANLAKTYSEEDGDISLKTPIYLGSRGSNVIAFYVYNKWIYLLDDEGSDIDPNDVEVEFLEKFIDYVSDTNNT